MPEIKHLRNPLIISGENQNRAHTFVGEYIFKFTTIEMMMDKLIISQFWVDNNIVAPNCVEDGYAHNNSVGSILQHSVLNSRSISFQLKLEIVKAIMQEKTPELYMKFGKKFFDLFGRLQQFRNLVAHFRTNVLNKKIVIYKPNAEWIVSSPLQPKGKPLPPKIGEYKPIIDEIVITKAIKDRLITQTEYVFTVVSLFNLSQTKEAFKIDAHAVETFLKMETIYSGGVFLISKS